MTSETTTAVERVAISICANGRNDDIWRVLEESEREDFRKDARAALAAALPTVCHEQVQGWTEDEARPCELPAVAFREDKWEGGGPPYPVCAKHATPDLVPLTVAILGITP
jgi:hypothetical protein